MKKAQRAGVAALLGAALLLFSAAPAVAMRGGGQFHGGGGHGHFAHRHFGHRHFGVRTHVFLGFGPAFWWPPAYPWYAEPVAVPYPVYAEPTVPATTYWYYCPSARAYYPAVPTCPEPWLTVVPSTP